MFHGKSSSVTSRWRSMLLPLLVVAVCTQIHAHDTGASLSFSSSIRARQRLSTKNYNKQWKKQVGKLLNRDLQDALDVPLPLSMNTRITFASKNVSKNYGGKKDVIEGGRFLKKEKSEDSTRLGISSRGMGKGKSDKKSSKSSKRSQAKSSKSSSSKDGKGGKGKGDNVFDNSDDSDSNDNGHGYPSSPVSSPTAAPVGGGGGPPTGNTPTSVNTPTGNPGQPTRRPAGSPTRQPTSGSVTLQPTNGGAPTNRPAATPQPTSGGAPVSIAPVPEPPSGREPPSASPVNTPSPPTATPRCNVNSNGLFGSQVGFDQTITFSYQLEVISAVNEAEVNLDILNNIEPEIGDRGLEGLFDQCAPLSTSIQRSSDELAPRSGVPSQAEAERGYIWGSTGSNNRKKARRHLRALQGSDLDGFSIRPRDSVVDGVECVGLEPIFKCFVIRGAVTAYTTQPMTDTARKSVSAAMREAVESEGLERVDNRVLSVSWRDLESDPIPGEGSPTAAPAERPTEALPTNGGNGPGSEGRDGDDPVLETWMIILIAVGGALILCAVYLCMRNPDGTPVYDDDDSPAESSDDDSDDEDVGKKERAALVASQAHSTGTRTSSSQPPPVIEEEDEEKGSSSQSGAQMASLAQPYQDQRPAAVAQSFPSNASVSDESSEEANLNDASPAEEMETSDIEEDSFHDEPVTEESLHSPSDSSSQGSGHVPDQAIPTAADNSLVSPFGGSVTKSESRWDEEEFAQSAPPPMDSTSEDFSSEYEEEPVEEEYEIEYVEEEDNTDDIDDEEEESYTDEWEEEEDGSEEDDDIVRDEPGGTPILPWLAQDDE